MADEIKQDALNPTDASGQEKPPDDDLEFERQMNLAEKIMRDDRGLLQRLSK
jgi:hypothetical protein